MLHSPGFFQAGCRNVRPGRAAQAASEEVAVQIAAMNWRQVEDWLRRDDRCVLPIGSTEQHAGLSLCVDSLLAERVALEAAAPTGVPVFPVVSYGLTPYFMAYPGTVSLRTSTYLALLCDMLGSLADTGFRRILIVNGHGGNAQVAPQLMRWAGTREGLQLRWHDWWRAPATRVAAQEVDRQGAHASWLENFPWTRLAGVSQPDTPKPMVEAALLDALSPEEVRATLGDGNMGGAYQQPDEAMLRIWQAGVRETRALLEHGWEGD